MFGPIFGPRAKRPLFAGPIFGPRVQHFWSTFGSAEISGPIFGPHRQNLGPRTQNFGPPVGHTCLCKRTSMTTKPLFSHGEWHIASLYARLTRRDRERHNRAPENILHDISRNIAKNEKQIWVQTEWGTCEKDQ